jgi:hypothetical protein
MKVPDTILVHVKRIIAAIFREYQVKPENLKKEAEKLWKQRQEH